MFGLNKIFIYIFIATMVLGSAGSPIYSWNKSIRMQALMEYNQKQLEQNARDQEEFARKQKEIAEIAAASARSLARKNEELNKQLNYINAMLDSNEMKKANRPSSIILRKTLDELRKNKQ
jgi:hypothetical protein